MSSFHTHLFYSSRLLLYLCGSLCPFFSPFYPPFLSSFLPSFSLVLSTSLISIFCLSLFLPLTPYFLNLASLVTASISISFFPPLHLFASCFLHLICFLLSFLIAFFPFLSFFIIFPQPLSPLPPLLKSEILLSFYFPPFSFLPAFPPETASSHIASFFIHCFSSFTFLLHVLFSIWWWKHLLALFGVISTLTL